MEAVSEIALQTREINQNIKRKGASGGEPDECLTTRSVAVIRRH
jgi:hypothetical protein